MDLIEELMGDVRQVASDFFDTLLPHGHQGLELAAEAGKTRGKALARAAGEDSGDDDQEPLPKKRCFEGLPVRIRESDFACTSLSGHKTLQRFLVDASGRADTTKPTPVLNPRTAFMHAGRNLRHNWQHNILFREYITFSNQKGALFRNMLRSEEQFRWIWSSDQPVFAGSTGVFALRESSYRTSWLQERDVQLVRSMLID